MKTKPHTVVIELEHPIERGKDGEKKITAITLRKPKAGELRGTRLADVLTMDVDAMIAIIPRISEPFITEADLVNLDPADLTALSLEVMGFLGGSRASPGA